MTVKRVDLSKLTPEQREALAVFYRDCKRVAPQMREMQETAKRMFAEFLRAPRWEAHEGQKPEQPPKQDVWSVKPEIRYVDHIEGVS